MRKRAWAAVAVRALSLIRRITLPSFVTPAQAGVHHLKVRYRDVTRWIPAFAGMTIQEWEKGLMQRDFAPAVYLMTNRRNGTLYVGVTSDLMQRVWQHREGTVAGFTSRYDVCRLVWFEMHATMEHAIQREKRMKKWLRDWKIRLIEEGNPDWRDLAADLGFEPHRVQFEIINPRHPRAGGGPSDGGAYDDRAGDGFPPSRE
jgi:putative endonuclease